MTKMLGPDAEVFTPYGATECLPVSSIGSREILGETRHQTDAGAGVCVGRPVPEVEVAIIPIGDEPIPAWADSLRLPPNQVGEITVTGPFVTRAYHARPEATRLAKIIDTPRGTHGFGYDPYFFYEPFDSTFAEASTEQKRAVSHRGRALAAMVEWLNGRK